MITVPSATYRLQFRDDMDFARAAALVPYLARLGASHLYASPLFAAAPGSQHGYDGTDFTKIEPAIGGDGGFDRLSAALRQAGLSLLLDFVPNHMAAHEANPWWRSVLEMGRVSPHAPAFDIDWSSGKLDLPILGEPFDEALAAGSLGLDRDEVSGAPVFAVYERRLPMSPTSCDLVASRQGADNVRGDGLRALSQDTGFVRAVHEAQVWRLVHWRQGRRRLNYRRFFEITDLVCLRVEDESVFDAVHARLGELVRAGKVDGLRIDHVDGLADPAGYLMRLQEKYGPIYTVVEKILEPGERLPSRWAVAGTTGYEFIAVMAGVFVDDGNGKSMRADYDAFVNMHENYPDALRAAKLETIGYNLEAELNRLASLAAAASDSESAAYPADALRAAIVALASELPVYRSYVTASGAEPGDRALIEQACSCACRRSDAALVPVIECVTRLALLDVPLDRRDAALRFSIRFQQTTGPLMAKAAEDTAYYRWNRLIALNEVGGAPDRFGAPLDVFHEAMADRRVEQPGGLSATATHDTKRGEDARARLYVLSEMPGGWATAPRRWSAMNASHRASLAGGPAPEPRMEWLFYQALAGAWPLSLTSAVCDPALVDLRKRMQAYMEKAVREAKLRTSWLDPDEDYEAAVARFVGAVLSAERSAGFLADFAATCAPVWRAGAVNGLAQLALKLFAPGVPDIYQGSEVWDFSLVDPDNRVPVDFTALGQMLRKVEGAPAETLLAEWISGAPKMALTCAGLRARAAHPALFREGDYVPLRAAGPWADHVIAFERRLGDSRAVAVAPRLIRAFLDDWPQPMVPPERWRGTTVTIPEGPAPFTDLITGRAVRPGSQVGIDTVLGEFPVALLIAPPIKG